MGWRDGQKQRPFHSVGCKAKIWVKVVMHGVAMEFPVPGTTNLRTGYPDPVPRIGTLSMAIFFSLLLFPAVSFSSSVFFLSFGSSSVAVGPPNPRTHARTDQISVMPLGNSIINRHGAKPGVNASAPRTLAPVARGPPAPAPYCTKVIRTTHWSCRTSL
ncbi:hypothetical protein V8C43DRAFT_298170 [Trichoderma afarasin]